MLRLNLILIKTPKASMDQSSDHATHILELGVGSAVIVSLLHSLPSATGHARKTIALRCCRRRRAHPWGGGSTHIAIYTTARRLCSVFDVGAGNCPHPITNGPGLLDPRVLEFHLKEHCEEGGWFGDHRPVAGCTAK